MPQFNIDTHPQKALIVRRICDGLPLREIVKGLDPPVAPMTMQRFKQHKLKPMLASARQSGDTKSIIDKQIRKIAELTPIESNPLVVQSVTRQLEAAPVVSLFRERLQKLYERVERSLDKAEAADVALVAPLLNQAHKNLDMLGRATGELEPASGPGIAIQIICPQTAEAMPRITFASPDQIDQIQPGVCPMQDIAVTRSH